MSTVSTRKPVVLERAAEEFVEATAEPPFLYELTPAEARRGIRSRSSRAMPPPWRSRC
jgi:hypothetical protein